MDKVIKLRLDGIIHAYAEQKRMDSLKLDMHERASRNFRKAFCNEVRSKVSPSLREMASFLGGRRPFVRLELEENLDVEHPSLAMNLEIEQDPLLFVADFFRPHLKIVGDSNLRRIRVERGRVGFPSRRYRDQTKLQLHQLTSDYAQNLVADFLEEVLVGSK